MDADSAKAIEVAACDGPVIYFIISRNFGLLKNFILRFLQQTNSNFVKMMYSNIISQTLFREMHEEIK